HRAEAALHRHFGAHAVGPEAVDLALLHRPRGIDAERYAGRIGRHRRRRDLHVVALRIDAVLLQQLNEADVDQWRSADPPAFHGFDIAALHLEVRAHNQEPVGVLRQRGDKLYPWPSRECGWRRMRRAADEIRLAVAQRLVALAD